MLKQQVRGVRCCISALHYSARSWFASETGRVFSCIHIFFDDDDMGMGKSDDESGLGRAFSFGLFCLFFWTIASEASSLSVRKLPRERGLDRCLYLCLRSVNEKYVTHPIFRGKGVWYEDFFHSCWPAIDFNSGKL